MGVIRRILLVLVAVLLFLSLLSLTLLWTLSLSLNYENVQRQSTLVAKDFLKEVDITGVITQSYPLIQIYCKNNTDYVFNYQGYIFDIPCSVALQGEDAIIEEMVKDAIHSIYYTEYDCNFVDCFRKYPVPLFLISEKTYNFWTDKMYLFLIASIALFVLMFLLVEKKINTFILSGILLIVSALPFIKLDSILSLLSDKLIFNLLWVFFSQSFYVSIRMIIFGAGFLALGILLDIFKIGFSISNLISKIKGEKKEKASKNSAKKPDKKSK